MISWPAIEGLPDALEGLSLTDLLPARSVFHALQASAAVHGGRHALAYLPRANPEDTAVPVTYVELLENTTRVANLLRRLGVGRLDVVAYLLPAMPETHYLLWGAETAGIAMPVNPLLQAEEIAALLTAANAKVLVALGPTPGIDIWAKARAASALAPSVQTLMRLGGGDAPYADLDFAGAFTGASPILEFEPPDLDDAAAYFHTGGTTGAPKLAVHTHRNQLAAAFGGSIAIGACAEDVMLNGLPMFHVAATIFGSLSMFLAGAQVLIPSPLGFRDAAVISRFWRIAAAHRVTLLGGVPTSFAAALSQEVGDSDLSALRASVCGAALTPPALAEAVERATGRPLREVYGMTECGGVICVDPIWTDRVRGSAGMPIAFCEVQARQIEAKGPGLRACGVSEVGVLVVRGPQVTPGYLQTEYNGSLFTADGWLITGDLGHVDSDGRVFITGRSKDLIIRGGHNIDPAVIENCLRRHPAVSDAAAVGMPDDYAGEIPVAYVTLKSGMSASEEELRRFAADNVAERPAAPRWVRVIDELPLTAVGKPYKPALRADAAQSAFREALRELPISSVEVKSNSSGGLTVVVRAVVAHGQGEPAVQAVREMVAKRLSAYSVQLEFAESASAVARMPAG